MSWDALEDFTFILVCDFLVGWLMAKHRAQVSAFSATLLYMVVIATSPYNHILYDLRARCSQKDAVFAGVGTVLQVKSCGQRELASVPFIEGYDHE